MYARTIASKLSSGLSPSAVARAVEKRAGQLRTIDAMASSGSQPTRALTAGPATRSSVRTISPTVTVTDGRLTAVGSPHAVGAASAARSSPSIARAGELSATAVSGGTGAFADRPASGSLMMPDRNPDAAALGRPGRTLTVIKRTDRPWMNPLRA